jgi:NAD(P)-dependent dehydrogenase (short-subunit alcohol dehydrogenase family)
MGTYVVTGSASGMGAATAALLRDGGHTVIGIDQRDADIVVDLATPGGRDEATRRTAEACHERLDGAALFAGIGGATGRPGSLLVSVNYFGAIRLFEAFRPWLAASGDSSAVAISSNSVTCQPGYADALVDACLADDEEAARSLADESESVNAYPATKAALARWVRRHAPSAEWAGAGVRLNAVAPGLVETAFVAETRADPVLGQLIDGFPIPIGRGGTAHELAHLVVFLLGPHARFFCGSVICCDGGTEALLRPDDWPVRWPLEL